MRKITLILMLLIVKAGYCQVVEAFNDADILSEPAWFASSTGYYVVEEGRLRSNSVAVNSNFSISTANTLATNCKWDFWINLKFNTSGANYVDVYLVSDKQDLRSANLNGYFLRIGGTDDNLSLYKRAGSLSSAIKLMDGAPGITATSNNILKISVTRNLDGLFTLNYLVPSVGNQISLGTVQDVSFKQTGWFGFYIQQSTASFFQKHYFDDILITQLLADVDPPKILSASFPDSLYIDITFNETVDDNIASDPLNYILEGALITTVNKITTSIYRIQLSIPLPTGKYVLKLIAVSDISGNMVPEDNSFSFFYIRPFTIKRGDVIINEIYANPISVGGTSETEFVELLNTTGSYILLNKWSYSDLTTSYEFGSDTLRPYELMILYPLNSIQNFNTSRSIGLSKWPTLNNDGDVLTLSDAAGFEIDKVSYGSDWYRSQQKKQNFHSLELIDPANICKGIQNWIGSKDPGGTPGTVNSSFRSQLSDSKPKIISVSIIDSTHVSIQFDKYMDSNTVTNFLNYTVNNGVGFPVASIINSAEFNSVTVQFGVSLENGIEYKINISGVSDCAGNIADGKEFQLYLAKPILKGDVLISEALFNPRVGGVDFVEIYNNSRERKDLQQLFITNKHAQDTLLNLRQVSLVQQFLDPGRYAVLTSAPLIVEGQYNVLINDPVQVALPSFQVSSGAISIFSGGVVIDAFDYTEEMHIPLLKIAKGVSLERISFQLATNAKGNFTSASAVAGFATPGYKNSVSTDGASLKKQFKIYPKVFSPDGDGIDDLLTVSFSFPSPGSMGSIDIYDDKGVLQKRLLKNVNLGTTGTVVWDGMDEQGNLCKIGIYFLKLEIFDLTGSRSKYI
ncbi:MAG: hypothetical protein EOO89_04105, partial [Pedobacter sp.]